MGSAYIGGREVVDKEVIRGGGQKPRENLIPSLPSPTCKERDPQYCIQHLQHLDPTKAQAQISKDEPIQSSRGYADSGRDQGYVDPSHDVILQHLHPHSSDPMSVC